MLISHRFTFNFTNLSWIEIMLMKTQTQQLTITIYRFHILSSCINLTLYSTWISYHNEYLKQIHHNIKSNIHMHHQLGEKRENLKEDYGVLTILNEISTLNWVVLSTSDFQQKHFSYDFLFFFLKPLLLPSKSYFLKFSRTAQTF